jgi:Protein of unknown function (DUF3551)
VIARMILTTLVLTTAVVLPQAARATSYWPWCSQYFDRSTARQCAYSSREQCMATVSGIGGICYANPYGLVTPGGPPRRHRHAARG